MATRKTASEPDGGRNPLAIDGRAIAPGTRTDLEIRAARLPTGTWLSVPLTVIRGRRPGPRLWVSAALHGDELNGIEIVRRVLPKIDPVTLRGTLIAAPILNVFGFLQQDRYLPDRRDLNRSFPGSTRGSLASRLAHLMMTEVVQHCQFGIDLHTGSQHRVNLPQIRADLDDEKTLKLATAFGAPIMMYAKLRDGSLRAAATERGCRVLVYEAGEVLRFDRRSIEIGVAGVMRVMRQLRMVPASGVRSPPVRPRRATDSAWIRARRGGIALIDVDPGDRVTAGQLVATVVEVAGGAAREIKAPDAGVVIGTNLNPVVNRGDALVHVAHLEGD